MGVEFQRLVAERLATPPMDIAHLPLPAILSLFGAALLLFSVVRQLPTPWGTIGPLSNQMRGVAGLAGLALILVAVYTYLHPPYPPVASTSTSLQPSAGGSAPASNAPATAVPTPPQASSGDSPAPRAVDTEKLIQIVQRKEREQVRDSTGAAASQCFTDADLASFRKARIPQKVAATLKKDADFIELVLAIKAMGPSPRQNLLGRAKTTYRLSWDRMNLDPNTASQDELRRGQTSAGSDAERLIAESIVDLVDDLCRLPESEVKKLYP
jgi:hypothetical protein